MSGCIGRLFCNSRVAERDLQRIGSSLVNPTACRQGPTTTAGDAELQAGVAKTRSRGRAADGGTCAGHGCVC